MAEVPYVPLDTSCTWSLLQTALISAKQELHKKSPTRSQVMCLELSSQQVSVKGCDAMKRHSLEVRKTAMAYRTSAIDAC